MPRKIVPLVTGETYHIFNRGVDKRTTFEDKLDFFRFHKSVQLFNSVNQSGSIYELSFQKNWIQSQEPLVDVNAYCVLGNHFHLILTQVVDGGISEFMKRVSGGYTSYFNEKYTRSGSLFQGTFKRVHCKNDVQLQYLAAYVNFNNIVHDSSEYHLSSIGAYTGKRFESFVKTVLILNGNTQESFYKDSKKIAKDIQRKRELDKEFNKDTFCE